MKHFSRSVYKANTATAVIWVVSTAALALPVCAAQLVGIIPESPALLMHSSQAYLGVEMRDIDNDRASALKLKETTGAEITYIDHDAPAAKVGLHIHDVILQMNGQQVQSVEQFRRMLRETPVGRSVTLLISRDGQQQTVNVQLADRSKIEQQSLLHPMPNPEDEQASDPVPFTTSSRSKGLGNSFIGGIVGPPTVGVDLDPLGSQLADYFGVKGGQGLLVKHVAENSPASSAGFKAGDVITKVNGESIPTLSTWYHALHANKGKPMQVTIVRNHQEQTLSLQTGDSKHKSELEWPRIEGPGRLIEPGDLDPEIERNLAQLDATIDPDLLAQQAIGEIDAGKIAEQAREAARTLSDERLQLELRKLGRDLESLSLELGHRDTF